MRKVLTSIFIVTLVAGLAFGGIGVVKVPNDFTTASQASNQVTTVVEASGYLEQIDIVPTGTFTSNVTITYTPVGGTAVNIYTNTALTAQVILHPNVDLTDDAGAAQTSDSPTRYVIDGGLLTVTVSNVNNTAATKLDVVVKTEK